ncbi:reverse transcriptase domain-containing protein [Tanacetum coccineum]
MVEDFIEVFMDDFLVFGHKIYGARIEVDRAKIDVIAKFPYPTNVKGVRSFLEHVGFYRSKQDAKPRLIRWVLLFKGLTSRLRIKKREENLAADHLSRLENLYLGAFTKEEIADEFPDEHLDEPYAFRLCPDNVMRRCIAGNEILEILAHCYGIIVRWLPEEKTMNRDSFDQVCDVFDIWGLDFVGPFPNSRERSVGYKLKNWSEKLDDALWAFRTAYKTPTGCTPFRLVYGKACHLPMEIEHKAYWALKECYIDLTVATKNHFMELNELIELKDGAYENTRIYKERTKRWHNFRLRGDKAFKCGDKVLLFNFRFKMHPGKLKSRWYGPNVVKIVYPYGIVVITDKNGISYKVNGKRLKKYYDECIDTDDKEVVECEVTKSLKSRCRAAHFYYDQGERMLLMGKMTKALDHAREGCERRCHLLKENFELTLRDAKVYTFHMNHIVAARAWSISFEEFILAPNNSFICYLNSIHQEATILELIGDKLMAMSALEWGKCLSLQRGPSFYLGRFHVAISRIYRKAQDINEAKKELRQAEELRRCVSCKSCQLLLKLEISKESAKQKRKFGTTWDITSAMQEFFSIEVLLKMQLNAKPSRKGHKNSKYECRCWECTCPFSLLSLLKEKGKDYMFKYETSNARDVFLENICLVVSLSSLPSSKSAMTLYMLFELVKRTEIKVVHATHIAELIYVISWVACTKGKSDGDFSIPSETLIATLKYALILSSETPELLKKVYGDDCDQDDNLYRCCLGKA